MAGLCAVGPTTESMVELDKPHLNFAAMAEGHGCKSTVAKTEVIRLSLNDLHSTSEECAVAAGESPF